MVGEGTCIGTIACWDTVCNFEVHWEKKRLWCSFWANTGPGKKHGDVIFTQSLAPTSASLFFARCRTFSFLKEKKKSTAAQASLSSDFPIPIALSKPHRNTLFKNTNKKDSEKNGLKGRTQNCILQSWQPLNSSLNWRKTSHINMVGNSDPKWWTDELVKQMAVPDVIMALGLNHKEQLMRPLSKCQYQWKLRLNKKWTEEVKSWRHCSVPKVNRRFKLWMKVNISFLKNSTMKKVACLRIHSG